MAQAFTFRPIICLGQFCVIYGWDYFYYIFFKLRATCSSATFQNTFSSFELTWDFVENQYV